MKAKKTFLTFACGLLTGIGLLFLLGASDVQGPPIGRYQVSSFSAAGGDSSFIAGWHGYYVIDTQTGKIVDQKITPNKW